jgi:hypothetical protein
LAVAPMNLTSRSFALAYGADEGGQKRVVDVDDRHGSLREEVPGHIIVRNSA